MIQCISEYEEKLAKDNYNRGREEGREEGDKLAWRKMSALKERLLSEDKTDVFLRAVDDRKYREQLFEFYFPNGIPSVKEAK